jgi:hypothetical protein
MSGYSGMSSPSWAPYNSSDSSDITWKTFDQKEPSRNKRNVDWGELGGTVTSLLGKARDTDKYKDWAERSRSPVFGDWSKGSSGQVLENLGAVYPQQQGPMFIPGAEGGGSSGLGSAIGTIAGIGASFIPGLGPGIARALPAIGSSVGSFFN